MSIDATVQPQTGLTTQITPAAVERERSALLKHSKLRWIHWFAVLMSLVLTVSIWLYSRNQISLRTEVRFVNAANQVADLIEERLQEYELALWGGVAALRTQDNDFDLEKWRTFARNLEIGHRFPGINGIGVIHQVKPDELEAYLAKQRLLRPDFRIHPPMTVKSINPSHLSNL